jgi:hypothetical protein
MKKATLTIGLFTLVMVLTSFANPTTAIANNTINSEIDGTGTQTTGDNKKVDFIQVPVNLKQTLKIDGTGTQTTGDNKKVD